MASRAREGYIPVETGDRNGRLSEDNPIKAYAERSDSRRSSTDRSRDLKPTGFISVWTFSLMVLGVSVMFLLGVCVGFYVRELQKGDPEFETACDTDKEQKPDFDKLGGYHETLVYYIRGEQIKEFVDEFGSDDPVTGSELERKLADTVLNEFDKYRFDSIDVEEHDVVVTSPDPNRPNQLEVLHHNGTKLHSMVLTNDVDRYKNLPQQRQTTTQEWLHPYIVYSPAGNVETSIVYGHYGQKTDFIVLQALGVDVRNKAVLLRMGKLSVADKISNCELHGVKAVILYWEPQDASEDITAPLNSSNIPFASAATYSTEVPTLWKPSIPCQTISADQASVLLSCLAQELNSVAAPEYWQGSLTASYFIGGESAGAHIVRLSVFNIQRKQKVKNIVSTIQGVEEPDRYVVVGAPRSSLPGQSQDVIASTSILLQLAHSFHYVHDLHYWKPRRGVKLVSWGGAEFSNSGMLEHIKNTHHLLDSRAVAYYDVRQLVQGNDSAVAMIPPGLHQLVKEATFDVPDPKNAEQTLQISWKLQSQESSNLKQQSSIPLISYHSDSTQSPFLHVLGVPTVNIQYRAPPGSQNSVRAMISEDLNHHYKFHIAVTRILVMSLLSLLDNPLLPFNMHNTAHSLQLTMWQTSGVLEECSNDMENLNPALSLCSDLIRASEAFEDIGDIFVKRSDKGGMRMINDIKMLFERLFITSKNGLSHHILYPALSDGSIAEATELCRSGQVTEIWNVTTDFGDMLTRTLTEAVTALRISA